MNVELPYYHSIILPAKIAKKYLFPAEKTHKKPISADKMIIWVA